MKIHLIVNGDDRGFMDLEDGTTGRTLVKGLGAPLPVTIMKLNGRFSPLPSELKDGDEVEIFITSSSG
jgi:sulfur carrier protein ThiS